MVEGIDEPRAVLLDLAKRLRSGDLGPKAVAQQIELVLSAPVPVTDNDRRWHHLEHGCQWVSWTETGGETHSFDPRGIQGLKVMRETADEQSAVKCWRCGKPMSDRPFCPNSEISAPCLAAGEHPPVPPRHRPVAASSSPLGDFDAVLAEYDRIVNGRLDPRDAEADFVMRGSDWRVIREALETRDSIIEECAALIENAFPRTAGECATRIRKLKNTTDDTGAKDA